MDSSRFTENSPGKVKRSEEGFNYFVPDPLPLSLEISDDLQERFFRSAMTLSKLDGRLSGINEDERFTLIDAFALKEAVTSSEVEGIDTDMGTIYKEEREKEKDPTKAKNNQEVRNYKDALRYGLNRMSEGDRIDIELLMEIHRILMQNARGMNKEPGKIRDRPVKVGGPNETLDDAFFVPPLPSYLNELMDDLMEYINSPSGNIILRAALAHYQFEVIHPFLDGNGRVGRILVMLMLKKSGLMENPLLYLSEYFKRRKKRYSLKLFYVSAKGEFEKWLEYFLDAVDSQTSCAMRMMDDLTSYRKHLYDLSNDNLKLRMVCDMLFENPYIRVREIKERVNTTDPTAQGLIDILVQKNVLSEVPGKRKGRLYVAEGILRILEHEEDHAWY